MVDGFYEWQWLDIKGKSKKKYLITIVHNEAFALAGLWSEWVNQSSGEIIKSYTILTMEANEQMSQIHNSEKRMPVILSPNNEFEWLSGKSFYYDDSIKLITTAMEKEK